MNYQKLLLKIVFGFALLLLAGCGCTKPTINPQQSSSVYLPLAIGNKWTYKRTVSQKVFSWEAYQVVGEKSVMFAAGYSPEISPGVSEETYLITDTVTIEGLKLWEVQVSDSNIRDGRYGAWHTKPDKILWGKVPLNPAVIEIDEILIAESIFEGEKRHRRMLLVELPIEDAEIDIRQFDSVKFSVSGKLLDVEAPVGNFSCSIETVTEVVNGANKWTTYSYYVPHVGLVKEFQKDDKGNLTYTLELTAYELK